MATTQRMLIDATRSDETRVAIVREKELLDFDFESVSKKSVKSNIYLGKIVRIEPSLQAAFVEYGSGRHGFLAFTEIHPDYFRIPIADRPELVTPADEEGAPTENVADNQNDGSAAETTSEEPNEEDARKKYLLYRNYKIQEVIKSKQIVLVQVVKEERGNKGAALTTFISLAGRYSVLMPNALHAGGVSRKITENEDRKRLKQMVADLGVPEGMSLIVRTAGFNKTKNEIKKDYNYLIDLWSKIRENTLNATAPSLIHEEPDLIKRVLRDIYTPDTHEVLVEGAEGYKDAKAFMKTLIPSHAKRIKQYKEKNSLFKAYEVDAQIEQIFSPKVHLKSGGYLVINATEALVAIDVNSGRATRERHIDSTALKTNLEAAQEVAKQVRIRDLSGLIVIDFIDMNEVRHNIAVEKRLKESLAMDRARIQVGRISQFGLLEMSRQRLRSSILEASSSRCPYCEGSGLTRSKESLSVQLIRTLEELSQTYTETNPLTVNLDSTLGFYLLTHKRDALDLLQDNKGKFFHFKQDTSQHMTGFWLEDKDGKLVADTGSTLVPEKTDKRKEGGKKKPGSHNNNASGSRNKHGKNQAISSKEEDRTEGGSETPESNTVSPDVSPSSDGPPAEDREKKNTSRGRRRRRGRFRREDPKAEEKKNESHKAEGSVSEKPVTPTESSSSVSPTPSSSSESGSNNKPTGKGKEGWWKKLLD